MRDRAAFPTTTGIVSVAFFPASAAFQAKSWKAGMFTMTMDSVSGTGIVASHFSDSSISSRRSAYGWLRAAIVDGPMTPSGVRPCRRWNFFTASTSAPPYVPSAGTAAPSGRSPTSRRISASGATPG